MMWLYGILWHQIYTCVTREIIDEDCACIDHRDLLDYRRERDAWSDRLDGWPYLLYFFVMSHLDFLYRIFNIAVMRIELNAEWEELAAEIQVRGKWKYESRLFLFQFAIF